MKIIFFEFGHVRTEYGAAAAMALRGHDVYIIDSRNIINKVNAKIKIEIGIDGDTIKIPVNIIAPKKSLSLGSNYCLANSKLLDSINFIDPDILIAGQKYWPIAKMASHILSKPLIFWNPVALGIMKIPVFIRVGKVYSRILTSSLGSLIILIFSNFSSITINNDVDTANLFKRLKIGNIEIISPTYARFDPDDAFWYEPRNNGLTIRDPYISYDNYVLSVVTLNKRSPSYNIEFKALKFIKKIALKMPDIQFLIIGSLISDLEDPQEFENIKNLTFLGKIYNDYILCNLYRRALCVLCIIYIPGHSGRLTEAFFYKKLIISTSIVDKYFEELRPFENIIYADDRDSAVKFIYRAANDDDYKQQFEKKAELYYLRHLSNFYLASKLEKMLYESFSRS